MEKLELEIKELIKRLKKFLNVAYIEEIESNEMCFVFERHDLISHWYYLHISRKHHSARVLITTNGVVSVKGSLDYKIIGCINALSLVIDEEYYSYLFFKALDQVKTFKAKEEVNETL